MRLTYKHEYQDLNWLVSAAGFWLGVTFFLWVTTINTPAQQPGFLNADGSIKLNAARRFDQKSYQMNLGKMGEPRLRASGDPSSVDRSSETFGFIGVGPSGTVVYAIAVSGSNVYVGGSFTTAGDITVNYIAKWDGTTWSSLGSGMNSYVTALAVAPNGDLYAGGSFTTAGGVSASNIAKWNGSVWSPVGSGLIGGVSDIEVMGSDIYASGDFVARWDGSAWSYIAPGSTGVVVKALAVSGSNLYAVGVFTAIGGVPAKNIAKWNGSSWSALGSGINSIVNAVAVSGSDVYVGGSFTSAGGVSANSIAKWDGSSWSSLGDGVTGPVNALAISENGTLYVGGNIDYAGGYWVNNIAQWNGSNWSPLGSGVSSPGSSWVLALAISGNGRVYVGGLFTTAGGFTANNIAVWTGSEWSDLVHYDPPSQQAANITFPNVSPYRMGVSWTNGNGTGRVVKINTADSFTAPADGTNPGWDSRYGGAGEQVVYNGGGSSITVTGLSPNTTYYFRAYEYNGSGSLSVYNTSTAANNPNSQSTISCINSSTVLNTNDDGVGSLRKAITEICTGGTIDFDPGVFATPQTIAMTSGELIIDQSVTIQGPGADLLSVSGSFASRVFYVGEAVATLDGMTIRDGYAGDGSIGYWWDGSGVTNWGTLTLSNSTITGNYAEYYAGGIRNFNTMTVINCTISSNDAYYGDGGIGNNGTMSVIDSKISNNSADGAGGIWNGGSLTIVNSDISGNTANGFAWDYYSLAGGGIFNEWGSVAVNNSTFAGNTGGYGGAIFIYFGSMTANSSTISGNTADYGGAISNYFGSMIADNSTISDNTASNGGGIFNYSYCDPYDWCYYPSASNSFTNSTIAGNSGGGTSSWNDGPIDSIETLKNTIIAGNTGGDINETTVETASNSLIGDAAHSGGIQNGVDGNIVGVNALLGPLQNNGGPTKTRALLAGSPAINAGDNCVLTVNGCGDGSPALLNDQRGMPRNGNVDIGAYERQSNEPTGRTAFDFDGDGKADASVFRPSEGAWYVNGSTSGFWGAYWGLGTDELVSGDYDGDGKWDPAIFRDGVFWVLKSTGGYEAIIWGLGTDTPVPADYDGDGRTDAAIFRDGVFWVLKSTGGYEAISWGFGTDAPVPADYDGDGKADAAIFRDGVFWVLKSTGGYEAIIWGLGTDKPIPADYDGDGRADAAIVRDGVFWILKSTGGYEAISWGYATDVLVPADYDGDGKADVAIFRNGEWWVLKSTGGYVGSVFGAAGDIAVPIR